MKPIRLLLATAVLAAGLPMASVVHAEDPELIVFDWATFQNPDFVKDYVTKYGMGPTYALFGDDDEAFQKMASGFKVDVVHPCSQMVSKYRDAGLIDLEAALADFQLDRLQGLGLALAQIELG